MDLDDGSMRITLTTERPGKICRFILEHRELDAVAHGLKS